MSRISLDLLQQFVMAARLGNLSRAAEQSNLTVSALSHQIRQLEQRVERKLFDRGPRGVQLTAEGRRLLEAVAHHFEGIDRAMATYRCRREEALTINTIPGVMSSWLVPRLARLVAAHPELELNLQSSVELVDFERDPVDATLRYGMGTWPGVQTEHLFGEWIAPVAAPSLMARMSHLNATSVEEWPLLGDPGGRWAGWFARFGGAPPKRFVAQFDNTDALQRAALEGMGVALGRMVTARPLVEAGLLQVLGNQYMRIPEAYYLVYPARSRDHAGLNIFRDWIRGEAKCYAAAMASAAEGRGEAT
ncbi:MULTISPECIES: LysR substrate-binding domain-containing protein [Dyella]|uniref:LysR family transcriptional regulator n=2 Tax=Dyella TaxID=231454 RepID=A0A4R0YLG4_9GAMM|nr:MULTISPECIES: LysR substrate-binding domain-containing protein [Dyella]TBR36630.1 LysR family transcriptional regulator [Dyella terrae]TCI08278.1 LysR family transcriptional regulator [Dyella soli]